MQQAAILEAFADLPDRRREQVSAIATSVPCLIHLAAGNKGFIAIETGLGPIKAS